MMASIVDQVREVVSPDVLRSVGTLIGESPSATSRGFATVVPTLLSGITDAASTPAGAQHVRAMINESGLGAAMLDRLPGMLTGGGPTDTLLTAGRQLLTGLFGGKQDNVTDVVAKSTQLPGTAVRSLMAIVAPIVMSVLGREISSRGLDTSGLMNLLASQRAGFTSLMPAGLATALGLKTGSVPTAVETEVSRAEVAAPRRSTGDVDEVTNGRRELPAWLWPAVAVALAALALMFLTRLRTPEVAVQDGTRAPSASPRQLAALTLPTGEKLQVKDGGFLQKLNAYLSSPSDTAVPSRFVFEDLTFETGSTALTPTSTQVVEALGRTLKAYPNVKIGVEGFTDASGDPAANKRLSQDRADAVKQALVQQGIGDERITTAGFGPERPVALNDSEEGRARNRRTEVVVLQR
jgi:outer membrane protein OmpA-like peptidoglycan-associated protein